MKLSKAIREGAKLRPQIHGDFFMPLAEGGLGSCALGAAAEIVNGEPGFTLDLEDDLTTAFPSLNHIVKGACIKSRGYVPGARLFDFIAVANDDGASREEIADFLESVGL